MRISNSEKYLYPFSMLLVSIAAIYYTPFLFVLFFIFVASFKKNISRDYLTSTAVLFLITMLTLVGMTKEIESDLANYISLYNNFRDQGFIEQLQEGLLSVRKTEPLYYFISSVTYKLTSGNENALLVVIHFITFLLTTYGIWKVSSTMGFRSGFILLFIFFGIVAAINFSQVSHLIRQYIAGSLMFCAAVFLHQKKYKISIIYSIMAVLTHNSVILILVLCFVSKKLVTNKPLVRISAGLILFIISYIFGDKLASGVLFISESHVNILHNTVGITTLLFDLTLWGILLLAFFIIPKSKKLNMSSFKYFGYIVFLYSSFLLGVLKSDFLFLRFYLYLEWFRIIPMIYFFLIFKQYFSTKGYELAVISMGIISLSMLVMGLRIERAPWSYAASLPEMLVLSLPELIYF